MYASIFIIGNPLLDIVVDVDDAYLKKWGLEPERTYLAENCHLPFRKRRQPKHNFLSDVTKRYDEVKSLPNVKIIPGGAAQNTACGVQWIIGAPDTVTYAGSIGKDDAANILRQVIGTTGVHTLYSETDKDITGVCAVLINKSKRTLITRPGACNYFEAESLCSQPFLERINLARIFYASGFFLDTSEKLTSILYLCDHCVGYNKIFVFNIGAHFVPEVFLGGLCAVLPYCDVLISNEYEAEAYAAKTDLKTDDLYKIALKLACFPKVNSSRARYVLITRGPKPTILAHDGRVKEYPPPEIDQGDIIDTNGAGDAFAAGLVAGLARNVDIEIAIKASHYAAQDVIRHSGSEYSKECKFIWPDN